MIKPFAIALMIVGMTSGLSGGAKGELSKQLGNPNVPVGAIITINGKKYKNLGDGHGVSCSDDC